MCSSCRGLRRLYEPLGLDLGWRSECYSAETDLISQHDSRLGFCLRRSAVSAVVNLKSLFSAPRREH